MFEHPSISLRLAAVSFAALLASALLAAAPARAAGEAGQPKLSGAPGSVGLPSPIAGNAVSYWRDGSGTVLGVSRNGEIAFLQVSGIPIIGDFSPRSGYAVDYEIYDEGCTVEYNMYGVTSGTFERTAYTANLPGGSTHPGKLITSKLVVTSTLKFGGGKFKLANVIEWKPGTLDFLVRQTYTNLTATEYGRFNTKYFMDVDVPAGLYTPASVSNFSRTLFSVTAWNDGSMAATLRTLATPEARMTEAYDFHAPPVDACGDGSGNLEGGSEPNVWRGDGAFGIRNWNFGIAPHGTEAARYRLEVRR